MARLRRPSTDDSDEVELASSVYGIGVSCAPSSSHRIQLDLQCVVVSSSGRLVDCAYYNNPKAGKGIAHSGDPSVAVPDGIEEMIEVRVDKLPAKASLLIFVVAAYAGGSLRDVADAELHVMEGQERKPLCVAELMRDAGSVKVVSAMVRGSRGRWKLRLIDLPAQQGRHFMDILPLLSEVTAYFVASAEGVRVQKEAGFHLSRGSVLDLPLGCGRLDVNLHYEAECNSDCQLDHSAVLMDEQSNVLEALWFGRRASEAHDICFAAVNANSDPNSETIKVDLDRVGPDVSEIFIMLHVYTPKCSFADVANCSCSLVDQSGVELVRFTLSQVGTASGLILAKFSREVGKRWAFHALGMECKSATHTEALPELRAASLMQTSMLRHVSDSSSSSGSDREHSHRKAFPKLHYISAHSVQAVAHQCQLGDGKCSIQ